MLENETLVGILKAANDAGATFGAICAGPLLLARAGLLKGRRFTHGYGPDSPLPDWKDGSYQDQPVVVDGNIVTAKPQAYIDFAIEVLYAAGCARAGPSNSWANREDSRRTQDLRLRLSRPIIDLSGVAHSTRGMSFVSWSAGVAVGAALACPAAPDVRRAGLAG